MDVLARFGRRWVALWQAWKREFLREPHVILFQQEIDADLTAPASRSQA